jgi:hypothetical protein
VPPAVPASCNIKYQVITFHYYYHYKEREVYILKGKAIPSNDCKAL